METIIPTIRLLHWTRWFDSIIFEGKDKPIENECLIPKGYQINTSEPWCTITTNQDEVDTADAFIFHAADYSFNDVPRRTGSPWILYTLESPLTAPFRQDPQPMKTFDYLASYHRKSRYFFTYFNPSAESKKAPILWIAKNCHASNGREHYISELMKYINVDSYGGCLNTKPFPSDKTREQLMTEYKFYLAIENANCEDYGNENKSVLVNTDTIQVTEKLVDSLKYSTVPIVDGPSSYDGYLPNQRSAIRMDSYPDPRDLARYIHFLDNNDDAYLAYFKHRQDALTKPPSERMEPLFVSLWSDQTAHDYRVSWCSICRHMVTTRSSRHGKDDNSGWKSNGSGVHGSAGKDDWLLFDNTCMVGSKWNYAADGPPYQSYSWTPTVKNKFAYGVIGEPEETAINSSISATTVPDLNVSLDFSLHPSLDSPLGSTKEDSPFFFQDRFGMLAMLCISLMVIGGVLWAVYRGSRKYRTNIKKNIPCF